MKKTQIRKKFDAKNFNPGNFIKQVDNESCFLRWYVNQPASAKMGFCGAAIIALLTHMQIYSNLILEPHLPGFMRNIGHYSGGRWFHSWANSLTFYYMNWATGLLQILFLSLIVFIVIKAFNIQNNLNALIVAGIMVTFPAVAETNLHFHDAAPYFLAALLSIAAFYVTKTYKFGCFVGVLFIMLGLAIYQSKIGLAMVASLVHLIIFLLKEKPDFANFLRYAARYLILIAGGLAAYYLSLQVMGLTLTFRNMSDMSLSGIHNEILRAYRESYYYFFSGSFRIDNRLLIFAYGFIGLTGLFLIFAISKKYIGSSKLNVILVAMLTLLLPLAANFSRVLDTGYATVLTMVTYAFTILLILPIIIFENFKIDTYGLKKLVAVALVFIIGYYISFSNFIYLRGEVIATYAMQLANRITVRVEPLLPYSDNNQLFINGNVLANPIYPNIGFLPEYTPRASQHSLFGGNNDFAGWPVNFFGQVIKYRVGLNITHPGDNARRRYLLDRAISYGMPVYPQEGSVALIDGAVVVMLNFFGNLDVEEADPNIFVATSNHTGKATDLTFEYIWYIYRDGQRLEQIYRDYDDIGYIRHEINAPGSYQFRVFVRLPGGPNVLNSFSPQFEVH